MSLEDQKTQKLYSCIDGHEVYMTDSQVGRGAFCKHPEGEGELRTLCGLPLVAVEKAEED